ncbi:hypothetical protein [Persicitalea jodogahamensis]|uniref:Uncharacterized protein n=1 Tax=Persicitalea jodogahamensis TaxID=402147 RepID=A0A8J3D483_9BACT|nr:hypothetical protein [Persicitalea jodogahamensis]GHB57036.1 hypothetical protein GCM10007390_08070 [Persicitalea jodogahamensis]
MDTLSNEEDRVRAAKIKSFKDSLKSSTELYDRHLDDLESIGKEYVIKLRSCQEYYTNIIIYRELIKDLGVDVAETVREFSPLLIEVENHNAVQEFKDKLGITNESTIIDDNNSNVSGASVDETNNSADEKASSVAEIEEHNTANNDNEEEAPKRVRGVQQYVLKILSEATRLLTTQEVSELVYKKFGKGISYTSITNSLSRLRKPEHDKIRRSVGEDGVSYYGIVKWFHQDGTPKQEILQSLVDSENVEKESEETQETKIAEFELAARQ